MLGILNRPVVVTAFVLAICSLGATSSSSSTLTPVDEDLTLGACQPDFDDLNLVDGADVQSEMVEPPAGTPIHHPHSVLDERHHSLHRTSSPPPRVLPPKRPLSLR